MTKARGTMTKPKKKTRPVFVNLPTQTAERLFDKVAKVVPRTSVSSYLGMLVDRDLAIKEK